jgi:hypothetical protein
MRAEVVPLPNKFIAAFDVVEQFPVKNHENAAVFVCHRLLPISQIDNTQSARSERDSRLFKKTFLIRTAVSDRTCHSLHDAFRSRALPNQINYSRDPAHNFVRID